MKWKRSELKDHGVLLQTVSRREITPVAKTRNGWKKKKHDQRHPINTSRIRIWDGSRTSSFFFLVRLGLGIGVRFLLLGRSSRGGSSGPPLQFDVVRVIVAAIRAPDHRRAFFLGLQDVKQRPVASLVQPRRTVLARVSLEHGISNQHVDYVDSYWNIWKRRNRRKIHNATTRPPDEQNLTWR